MRIFLIGFMGSGKTTTGHVLAWMLHYQFIDSDKEITTRTGLSIPDIFSSRGETWFRQQERETLLSLLHLENAVISTGGGMPCFADNMELMNQNGVTVYLKMSPEALYERLLYSHTDRPLIRNKPPEELMQYIRETLQVREDFYLRSKIIIHAQERDPNEIAQEIYERISVNI